MEKNYVDPNSMAENAGNVTVSREKFNDLRDNILKVSALKKIYFNKQFKRLGQYLANGDTQPAVVVSTAPLVIAAYSDELDGVLFLKYPDILAEKYSLTLGSRLVTSNVYFPGTKVTKEIITGPNYLNRYTDFTPTVQLFICDDENYINSRTQLFDESTWKMVEELAMKRFAGKHKTRNGFELLTRFRLLLLIF